MKIQNREEDAYRQLKEKILAGELIPGDILSEASLSQGLGMSRTPVRYALKQLEYEGFITYHKNRGISIRETSSREMVDILEMMILFEHSAVKKVKNGVTIFNIAALKRLGDEAQVLRNERQYASYIEKTHQYNSCFIASAGNSQLTVVYNTSWERVISTSVYNKMTHPTAIPKKTQTTVGFIHQLNQSITDEAYDHTDRLLDEYFDYARNQILYYGQI